MKFLWGSATSAYQIEGNNTNADWWEWDGGRSGRASFFWEKWEEVIELLHQLKHNAFRMSIEWSRIFPSPDEVDREALDKYRRIIESLMERGIEPVITLHHFTNPIWFSRMGGWLRRENITHFIRFVESVLPILKGVRFVITINEPNVYAFRSYMEGYWPPQEKSMRKAFRVLSNMKEAHIRAYQLLKSGTAADVSIAQNMMVFEPAWKWSPIHWILTLITDYMFNWYFPDRIRDHMDFLGINYYSRGFVRWLGSIQYRGDEKNCMGWEVHPQGLYRVIKRAYRRYRKPIMITENGICTDNDFQRIKFLKEHVEQVMKAREEGIPVIGYLYWSLLDNYEWAEGFEPRFGLLEVDYDKEKYRIRKSALFYSEIIETDGLAAL